MNIIDKSICTDQELIDTLIFNKEISHEFSNNKNIVQEFTTTLHSIMSMPRGHALITIDIKKQRLIFFIIIVTNSTSIKYKAYISKKSILIDNPVSYKVHEINSKEDTFAYIQGRVINSKFYISPQSICDLIITETLGGYCINIKKYREIISESNQLSKAPCRKEEEFLEIDSIIEKAITNLEQKIQKFTKQCDCDKVINEFALCMSKTSIGTCVTTIDKVIQGDNSRWAFITTYRFVGNDYTKEKMILTTNILDQNITTVPYRNSFLSKMTGSNLYLNYNFLDVGRIIVGFKIGYSWKTIISNDPKVTESFKSNVLEDLYELIKDTLESSISIEKIRIYDNALGYNKYMTLYASRDRVDFQSYIRSYRLMVDEYKYIAKKKQSKKKNIKVTDSIAYDNSTGTLKCNDFVFRTDTLLVRSSIFRVCNEELLLYFRKQHSEQKVIDTILYSIYTRISDILRGKLITESIDIQLNDKVDINITIGKNKNKFTYINNKRFNKNEIIPILKELICYRSKESADSFIESVGNVGLSVYIGITSGYIVNKRIYKFNKLKDRSKYQLIIGDTVINIKGKKLFNVLYDNMLRHTLHNTVTDKIVYNSTESIQDYIDYKLLIESSYEKFIQKSKEFLDKKVQEVDGEYVVYTDTRGTNLTGIKLQGISGTTYIVAYDTRNSFTFINAWYDKVKNVYRDGKYMCMIDRSSVKSTVGYDTVISKIMSLRSDSIIASNIYNLEEELGK